MDYDFVSVGKDVFVLISVKLMTNMTRLNDNMFVIEPPQK
jgi:hypothetical protein